MGEKYMLESLWVKNPWGKIGVDGMLAFVPPSQVKLQNRRPCSLFKAFRFSQVKVTIGSMSHKKMVKGGCWDIPAFIVGCYVFLCYGSMFHPYL